MNVISGQIKPPAMGEASSELDVVHAVRAAHAALDDWAKRPATERAAAVESFARALKARVDELTDLESRETATPLDLARDEVTRAIAGLRAAAPASAAVPQVVGLITPRACVTRTLVIHLGRCLTVGHVAVVKPSSRAPGVAAAIGRAIIASDLPAGVCNIVFGAGPTVGRFMVEHPGVPSILFFGKSATGRAVMSAASAQLKRLAMGLGAKNAAIVLKDADLDAAVPRVVRAAFGRAGLDPFALSKILVAREIETEFAARIRAAITDVRLAHGDDATEFERAVALARTENGRVTGGRGDGLVVTPAVVEDLTHCSEIHQDELLVPLLTLNTIKYAHEGVKWANTSPYGRAAAVFTANADLARKLAGQLEVGSTFHNGWRDDHPGADEGQDLKASGFGNPRALGLEPRVFIP